MSANSNMNMGQVQVLGAKQIEALQKNYDWAVTIFDTSKVLTFLVSLGLIVCGSFRAMRMESKGKEGEESENNNTEGLKSFSLQDMHTIESSQAFILPLGASVSLFIMFYFFDNLQLLFIIMTAVLAIIAFSFLLLPVCQYLTTPCFNNTNRISLCCFGRFTSAEICSIIVSSFIVVLWVFTGHWLLMDALAMAFSITMIAFVRLPSLKVSVILLFGLLIYDIFWVFISEYIFSVNVMVKVATQPAYNPVNYLAKKFHLQETLHVPSQLSLPGKLVFPSSHRTGQFSMLGIGDIVMPGLLLCFVLRYENHKKSQCTTQPTSSVTYFHCSLIGYLVGLFTATLASELSMAAQPALLYLVPFTILPLVIRAYIKGDLKTMWSSPFPPNGGKEEHLEV